MVAIGVAKFVKGDWVKPGAVVVDCGINTITGKHFIIFHCTVAEWPNAEPLKKIDITNHVIFMQ